ncbi:MAG: hypothetical protein JWR54_1796 [Mucilaginibacter sp.]|nr:hypothetical protein [Mucilaginibacter sp.]
MSAFETIVHQTLQDLDNPNHIEDNGPFHVENIDQAFLGSGYYFWDDHIELAHYWGEVHCGRKYVICAGELSVEKELFFDLVGNRKDMIYFKDIISRIPELENMPIGKIIEFLKDLNSRPNKRGIFPFKVLRAIISSVTAFKQDIKSFASKRQGNMTLTPQIMICLVEKNNLHLQSYKIIYPDKYI